MSGLIELLAQELERPRNVSAQVVNHLIGTYGITREAVGSFLVTNLPELEDYEIDLILSPLFTPTLRDQSPVAAVLGDSSVPASQWPALVQALAARPTMATLITEDGEIHQLPLRDVTIERYVNRLRLDGSIAPSVKELVATCQQESDVALLKAVCRRAIWEKDGRCEILTKHLKSGVGCGECRIDLDDVVSLLKLVETYEPANIADLLARIPHWQRVLREEINIASGPKPFFNERVQELHGGGRDRRQQETQRIATKESERVFLERLERALTA